MQSYYSLVFLQICCVYKYFSRGTFSKNSAYITKEEGPKFA